MENVPNALNKRVLLLKTKLNLIDIKFCELLSISTFTLHSIKKGGTVGYKVINSILENTNVSESWLLEGKGDMFKVEESKKESGFWKEEAYSNIKDAYEAIKKQLEYLQNQNNLLLTSLLRTS